MVMDIRTTFVIAMGILLFTMYYLEKEMDRDQIYSLFAVLSAVMGLGTVYLVAKRSQFYEFFIILTVLFVVISILYHEGEEAEHKVVTRKKKMDRRKSKAVPAKKTEKRGRRKKK
ncbi:MAG: hypothetical protein ACE5G7_04800 [Candidatus Hydrothermarchaeaceae archaeon]